MISRPRAKLILREAIEDQSTLRFARTTSPTNSIRHLVSAVSVEAAALERTR
jgi:hypothetical protein